MKRLDWVSEEEADKKTRLSDECILWCRKMKVEDRSFEYLEELVARWQFRESQRLMKLDILEIENLFLDAYWDYSDCEESHKQRLELRWDKEGMIVELIEDIDWSSKEYIDWIVCIYMND